MNAPLARVRDIAQQIRGVTYTSDVASSEPQAGFFPIVRAGNITDSGLSFDDLVYVPASCISSRQFIRANDIVIATSSGSIDVVGKSAQAYKDFAGSFGAFCKVLRPLAAVDPRYFGHYFRTPMYRTKISSLAAGANINNLRNEHLDELSIRLPSLEEQQRAAKILDQAETLCARRRQAIATLNDLGRDLFLAMFANPASNPMNWPLYPLGELAVKFSDGPFGSNLKSSHYTDSGVRVVRLQNIGTGEFIDDDKAFISEDHFASLKRHTCLPGDILIGTLGDPNLRACIQPPWLERALNKADCVQMRVSERAANPIFVCSLLNQSALENKARSLMLGQTRIRISMGRLRTLKVPVPPLPLQEEFARRFEAIESLKRKHKSHLRSLNTLLASLQYRAFHEGL